MPSSQSNVYSKAGIIKSLLQHKLSKWGILGLLFCIFIALFAYVLSADNSPNANRVNPVAAYLSPGSVVSVFYPKDLNNNEQRSFISRFFIGASENANGILFSYIDTIDANTVDLVLETANHSRQVVHTIPLVDFNSKQQVEKMRSWLGTDHLGRDVMSRLLIGSRVSLAVGILSVFLSLLIGLSLGLISGYFGGKVDASIMWFASIIWSLPTLLLVLAISFAIGKGFWQIFIAIGLSSWVELTRIVRGEVLSIKQKEFILAAKLLHLSNFSILFRHLLPNVMPSVIVISTANFASAILLEAGLSFLGLGVKPPTPSWGMMINEYSGFMLLDNAYLAFIPGIAIMFLVISVNFIGMGLRDVLARD